MNIRSLKQYISSLAGTDCDISLLGKSSEPFFVLIDGKGTHSQVRQWVRGSASFASNAEEQLFYEFVQNAFDASADSLLFFSNEHYLIVLNNGKPFYTDSKIFDENIKVREGQLYNFLAKGKSLKSEDETSMGKYGQGSKLLYTLITDVSEGKSNEELLEEAIYQEHKGPYLISWANKHQLNELLNATDGWQSANFEDIDENILFAKILLSYYPVAPGEATEFFPESEVRDVIQALDTLVDPRTKFAYLKSGTALIIPLGKGKYNRIQAPDNMRRVKTRLGGFASITKDQKRNYGKHLDNIFVMKDEVEQQKVVSAFVDFKLDGKDLHFQFAFNPILHNDSYVNLFKGLPILDTKLNLGFIIDSQNFEVDDSRQRITDKSKTSNQLRHAFAKLLDNLKEVYKSDKEEYVYIYKSLLATSIRKTDEDVSYVSKPFREVFLPFFADNVLSEDGKFYPLEQCRTTSDECPLPLNKLGITTMHWANRDILKNLKYHNTEVQELSFREILKLADPEKLRRYILTLKEQEYVRFQHLCEQYMSDDLKTMPLFKTNKRNLVSYASLRSSDDIYYFLKEHGNIFSSCEYVIAPLAIATRDYIKDLINKVGKNIDTLRTNHHRIDDCCTMLDLICKKSDNDADRYFVLNNVHLLKNWEGEFCAFTQLLSDVPAGSQLFNTFKPKGYCPSVAREWMTSGKEDNADAFWNWIVKNLPALKRVTGWGPKTMVFLQDLKNSYSRQSNKSKKIERFYLDQTGRPSENSCVYLDHSEKLTASEYKEICALCHQTNLVSYAYKEMLNSAPFGLTHVGVSDIITSEVTVNKDTLKTIVSLDDYFLNHFYVNEISTESFQLSRSYRVKNYSDNDVSNRLQQRLQKISIYHIPEYVQSLIGNVRSNFSLVQNSDLMKTAIREIDEVMELLPLVKRCNADVIKYFFQQLKNVDISQNINEQDLRWQLIEFASRDYASALYGKLTYCNSPLPQEIVNTEISVGARSFKLYDLNASYKAPNETIDAFLKRLPDDKARNLFKDYYCAERFSVVPNAQLYFDLASQFLTVEQCRFCLAFLYFTKEKERKDLKPHPSVIIDDLMDMIQTEMFKGFDHYLTIPGFKKDVQVFASIDYLLPDEYLPASLYSWLDKHKEGVTLFDSLKTAENYPFVSWRIAVDKEQPLFVSLAPLAEPNNLPDLQRMSKWLLSKEYNCAYLSQRYFALMQIISAFPESYSPMILLQFTGEVEKNKPNAMPMFKLAHFQKGGYFFSTYCWSSNQQSFLDLFRGRKELQEFFKLNTVYSYEEDTLLNNHNLHKEPRLNIVGRVAKGNYVEWDNAVYRKWKGLSESKGVTILLSKSKVGYDFSIESGKKSLKNISIANREYGCDQCKAIVVTMPNQQSLSVMKMIAKHIGEMNEFFKDPFISLQAMFVDAYEDVENGKSVVIETDLPKDKVQEVVAKMTSETLENMDVLNELSGKMDGQTLTKLLPVTESIAELLKALDAETIALLNAYKEKLLDMLMNIREEEEPTSKVRITIGYIGEMIFKHYLDELRDMSGKPLVYEYVADDNVGEYDFLVHSGKQEVYIDVKTNLYSFKMGNVPFYIHKSQNKFMFDNPEADFRIVRISLKDLGIEHEYLSIRDFFGPEQDPRLNKELRIRCDEVAEKAWNVIKRHFRALSPEYGIKIEQVKDTY